MFTLALTPSGRLITVETSESDGEDLPASAVTGIRAAFAKNVAEGLLHLATLRLDAALPAVFSYWRSFGERYLTALCHIPETAEKVPEPLPSPDEDWPAVVQAAPPMRGGEYLRVETLQQLWSELDDYARGEIARCPGGLSQWLHARSPLWHRVGRVCFHLAENKRDPECPFAFLATYAPKLLDGRRVQYQPLGKALEEYAGAKNKRTLVNLLAPVERASRRCAWVKELVDSGEVFHPLRWTPGEAYRFLQDAPALEESGVLVRMPDWWSKTPPRVRVGVSIGQKRQSQFGVDAMLDFQVRSGPGRRDAVRRGMGADPGLQRRPGVPQGPLGGGGPREAHARCSSNGSRCEQEAGADGVSFLQGMRLLAGAPLDAELSSLFEAETASWSEVRAGDWLEARLQRTSPAADPGRHAAARRVARHAAPLSGDRRQVAVVPGPTGPGRLPGRRHGLGQDDPGHRAVAVVETGAVLRPVRTVAAGPARVAAGQLEVGDRAVRPVAGRPLRASVADRRGRPEAGGRRPRRSSSSGADVVITTYSMLARLPWLSSVDWRLVVLDEAQAVKNPAARQTRAVKQLKAAAKIALTGTPVENRLTDLWSIFDFLCPGLLGSVKAFGEFVKRLEKREQADYGPLRKLVAPYILRRLKTDVDHRRPAGQDRDAGLLPADQEAGGALRAGGPGTGPIAEADRRASNAAARSWRSSCGSSRSAIIRPSGWPRAITRRRTAASSAAWANCARRSPSGRRRRWCSRSSAR